jgi:hypothetical protein
MVVQMMRDSGWVSLLYDLEAGSRHRHAKQPCMQVMRDQDHRRVDTAQQVAVQKVVRLLFKQLVLQHTFDIGGDAGNGRELNNLV